MTDYLAEVLHGLVGSEVRGTSCAETASATPQLLSIPQACAALGGLSRAMFYRQVVAGLRVVHVGRRVFVADAGLRRFCEQQQAPLT